MDNTDKKSGFAGTLKNIQITDIIQMCCLAGSSICIRVSQDNNVGMIFIHEGEIIHAEYGNIEGIEAFFTILKWEKGLFETLDFNKVEKNTIKEPYQYLLMEAARLADEVTNKNTADQKNELNKIKVLIVDDSPIMSKIINSMLEADQLIEVVKCAKNGEEALEIIRISPPDIITMDVNMPVMDGSTALKHIMIESPCPVMIMSNLGDSSYSTILNFMNLGAVDFMSKPVKNKNIVLQQQKMVERIRLSSKAKIKRFKRIRFPKIDLAGKLIVNENKNSEKLIIINSGVGGYLEMVNLILNIPCDDQTTIVSIQAIPPLFTPVLSNFLNSRSIYDVKPISNKNILCANRCYIGSNGIKLNIKYSSSLNDLTTEPDKEDSHDQNDFFNKLLLHASRAFKDRVIVVLLSGAELKGMEGLSAIKQNGGRIITPQLSSCILPTTLEPIVDKGIVDHMINLENIASILKNKTPVG